jgi:DNA-binding SARP family transcriptional activator
MGSQRPISGQRRPPRVTQAGALGDVRIWLLGGFRVSVGSSRSIGEDEWRLRKAGNLIKLLALAPGHRLHREQAMDLLWPELESGAASNNLHHALHVARRTLGRRCFGLPAPSGREPGPVSGGALRCLS